MSDDTNQMCKKFLSTSSSVHIVLFHQKHAGEKKVSYWSSLFLSFSLVKIKRHVFHRASEKSDELCINCIHTHFMCKFIYCPYTDTHTYTTEYVYRCMYKDICTDTHNQQHTPFHYCIKLSLSKEKENF